jgi:hypothetical protein
MLCLSQNILIWIKVSNLNTSPSLSVDGDSTWFQWTKWQFSCVRQMDKVKLEISLTKPLSVDSNHFNSPTLVRLRHGATKCPKSVLSPVKLNWKATYLWGTKSENLSLQSERSTLVSFLLTFVWIISASWKIASPRYMYFISFIWSIIEL